MFTGITEEIGRVRENARHGDAYKITIEAKDAASRASIGDSVAVNGVCLTIVGKKNGVISFDVMEETAAKSTTGELKKGEPVNLETALKPDKALGGHFVLGHVDCVGRISSIAKAGGNVTLEISFPGEFAHLVVEKGSIAIDGISLTPAGVKDGSFKVHIIPHTLGATTLGHKKAQDKINIEFDIIGKYTAALKAKPGASRLDEEFLRKNGW